MKSFSNRSLIVLFLWLGFARTAKASANFVWLEGESARSTIPFNTNNWGRPDFLSGGLGLNLSIEEDKVDKAVPAEGIVLSYPFEVAKKATYDVWNRVGFEFVRSPFEWRIDSGPWKKASPDDLTTDLMEIGFWSEVAWLHLGNSDLSLGHHQLDIRLSKNKDDKGKWQRLLYSSDALCLFEGAYQPHGKFRPDDSGRTPADQQAADHVFRLPEAPTSHRSTLSLAGDWEVARDDEQFPGEVAEPIRTLPQNPNWHAIPVPSDKNKSRPDLLFAHRVWYRTRVFVPATMADRAYVLDFPGNNLNTTVYVNGVFCGFEKNPFAPFTVDVTQGIVAGRTNEVWVGIRDAWYGRSADPKRPLKLRKTFNYPLNLFSDGFQDLDYPVWNCPQSGILTTPTFIATGGSVYVSDVFLQPSVHEHRLAVELSLRNTHPFAATGEIRWEAVRDETGQVEHAFPQKSFSITATNTAALRLDAPWTDAILWWPDSPHLYRLRTTILVNGQPVDVQETTFGFREWRREGTQFTLNGVVWHLWADLVGVDDSPDHWLEAYQRTGQRTMRLSTAGQAGQENRWLGLEPRAALDFFDRHGVVVRRNTTLDGERIGYQFSEGDPITKAMQGGFEGKLTLMKNWRDQCVAQVRGERNHPSIQIWSLENEFSFINLINLLGNSPLMDQYEEQIAQTYEAVMAVDPTRSAMTDGGGAMKRNLLGVAGDHYVATLDSRYPDLAYEPFETGGGRGRWQWDRKRPRFIGEDFFATGINPSDYATWGGEVAFQGKAATRGAVGTCYRMLQEGYRWGGYFAGWHFWLAGEGGTNQWIANAPRAALVREWNWSLGSGDSVKRTYGVFNDTQYTDPLTFTRRLDVNGRETFSKTTTLTVAPGTAEKFEEPLSLPPVTTRTEGQLLLSLSAGGRDVFRDSKAISILPPVFPDKLTTGSLGVWDPSGDTKIFLQSIGQPFLPLTSLESVPTLVHVIVVGRDAISAEDSTSTRLSVLASEGRSIVVLDQTHPLKYGAIPAQLELAPATRKDDFGNSIPASDGHTAFLEDTTHPALTGLLDKDFFTWGPGQRVFRNAYLKPTRGAKSLLQCGPRLEYSALVEIPVGQGVLYLSQLDFQGQLTGNPVAKHLLMNLIQTAAHYQIESADVSALITDAPLAYAVDAIGLHYAKATDPNAAIGDPKRKIALVSASSANLKWFAQHPAEVKAFWDRGGTLMVFGVTPEGIEDFNSIVGVHHVIRPFKRERVTFPAVKEPLTAGLTVGDIVMLSGQRIFGWNADEYVSSEVFSHIVDMEDVAPFARSDFPGFDNIVNGFVGSDGWPLIMDFEVPKDGSPYSFHLDLPQEETIVEYTHDPSVNYNPTTRIALSFDDRDRVEYPLQPNGDAQTFVIDPPRKAKRVTVQILKWQSDPAKRPLVGIDNIYLKAQRSPEWHATVKTMLNIGGLVHYVKGKGGVVLCNLRFQDQEAVPVNLTKKRTILATVLRNLKAPFSGGKTVIAGSKLEYTPIDLHTKATTFKDERGWFGDANRTLKSLPSGEQLFAGVRYNVYELATSPVPQVVMLQGSGVPGNLPAEVTGIPVNTQADALFFLHTARLDRRADERERQEQKRFELARYVVHYVDGQTVEVPVYAEVNIDHFVQKEPKSLSGAQLAWSAAYPKSDESATVYAQQWNNPRPGVGITTVDLVYGKDKDRGVPVLIAITAAKVGSER